ncbi:arginase family protein [Microbacterium foliorum]
MALGPHVLLADDGAQTLAADRGHDVSRQWLDDLDEATERDYGDDPRLLPPGDQMVRQLVQCNGLSRAVSEARAQGRFPVIAAGNCHTGIGVVGGLDDPEIGMIWFDAHADANTPETSSNGMFEGMPVAVIAGKCFERWRSKVGGFHVISEDRIITVGNHEVHSPSGRGPGFGAPAIGILVDPPAIAEKGFRDAMRDAVTEIASRVSRVYVHIDTDVIDKGVMSANRHAAEGGLTPEEIVEAVQLIAEQVEILAVNFTAYDPTVDPGAKDILIPLVVDVAEVAASAARTR